MSAARIPTTVGRFVDRTVDRVSVSPVKIVAVLVASIEVD